MKDRLPGWAASVSRRWNRSGVPELNQQAGLLRKGIRLLAESEKRLAPSRFALPEQPFDLHLLDCSPLYRRSRRLYRSSGGEFLATLVSSPRSLSSAILLEQKIEFSPLGREMVWAATDPRESRDPSRLLTLRTYCTSLFHEQNHRTLWRLLPAAPKDADGLRRYLNYAESLVIVTDMALGDALGPELASLFYLIGVTYDPGSTVRFELPSRRVYRNYLQAALHATYLNLELYDRREIPRAISALFPGLGPMAERAARRAGNLDAAFIRRTNLVWQKLNRKAVIEALGGSGGSVLELADDPLDNRLQYIHAERWFDVIGL